MNKSKKLFIIHLDGDIQEGFHDFSGPLIRKCVCPVVGSLQFATQSVTKLQD